MFPFPPSLPIEGHNVSVLHHFLTCLFAQTFLTTRIRNTSIRLPFAIGQRADILQGDLDVGSRKLTTRFLCGNNQSFVPQVAVKILHAVPYDDKTARQELRQVQC
jgi:hypothetical protein